MANAGDLQIRTRYVIDRTSQRELQQNVRNIGRDANGATKGISNMTKGFKMLGVAAAAALSAVAIGTYAKDAAKIAMTVESSTKQIERLMGASAQTYKKWVDENARSLGIAKADAIAYGATFANLTSTFAKSTDETAQYTQDLIKASTIISSSTGRSMEDVMERVRSGMLGSTEAIEDLGINVNVSMIESTNAFKKFADGKSWSQLDFQLQQQIRLFAILEQTTSKYGTEIAQSTSGSLGTLSATLKDIALNIGNALLPAINAILPFLQSLASKIELVTRTWASFSEKIFGKKAQATTAVTESIQTQAVAVGEVGDNLDSTAKSAKNASKQLAGFDDLISISSTPATPTTPTATGVGVSETQLEPLTPQVDVGEFTKMTDELSKQETLLGKINSAIASTIAPGFVEDTKQRVSGIITDVKKIGGTLSTMFNDVKPNMLSMIGSLGNFGSNLAQNLTTVTLAATGTLVGGISDSLESEAPRLTKRMKDINDNMARTFNAGTSISNTLSNIVTKFFDDENTRKTVANVTTIVNEVTTFVAEHVTDFVADCAETTDKVLLDTEENVSKTLANISEIGAETTGIIATFVKDFADTFKENYDKYVKPAIDNIGEGISKIINGFLTAYNEKLHPTVMKIIEEFKQFYGKYVKPLVDKFVEFSAKLVELGSVIFNEFIAPLVVWFSENLFKGISSAINLIWGVVEPIGANFSNVFGGIIDTLGGLIDFLIGVFTGDWKRAWEGVKGIFKGIFDTFEGIVKAPLNGVIGLVNLAIKGLNKINVKVPSWVPKIGGEDFGFNIPKIPLLAEGGLIKGRSNTLAMIGERSHDEAVIPLVNGAYDRLAGALSERLGNNGGDTYEVHIHAGAVVGGDKQYLKKFASEISGYIEDAQKQKQRRSGGLNYGY